jgi:DNA-binding CsgD family transcriptional regulator
VEGLDLSPSEIAAVRCVLAFDAADHPDFPVRAHNLLAALRRLVPCDRIALLVRDAAGRVELRVDHPPCLQSHRAHDRLVVVWPLDGGSVAQLRLDRYRRRFEPRYAELMHMLQPALVRQVRPPAGAADPVSGLSDLSVAELQVLRLVAGGATNRDVADQLSVSEATVRKHLEHVYRKLGVTNRTAASARVRTAAPA